uniref:Uncharacterized protein n=1 Tax=Panagrolaimus sp. PS1159 TaxID=55785 RepID=A0AC35G9I6_9BILA
MIVFDLFFNIFICFLLQPIPIIPGGGVVIAGIAKFIGPHCGHIVFTLAAYSFTRCIVGLNYCFLYRFSCLCADEGQRLFKYKWFKGILFGSAEVISLSIAVLIYAMEVPPEHFYKVTVAEFPQQLSMFKEGNIVFGYDYRQTAHANMFIFTCVFLGKQK